MVRRPTSLKIGVVAVFVAVTFAMAGLTAVTLLVESPVLAQNEIGGNETGGNETGTANTTALFSTETGMVAENKR